MCGSPLLFVTPFCIAALCRYAWVVSNRYCLAAIDRALTSDEANGVRGQRSGRVDIEGLIALRQEIFGDQVLPGSAVDLIRDARDIRAAQLKDIL